MTAAVRVGVVGTGFGRRVVAPVFAATEGCEVVDVVSARDQAAVERLCARADVDLVSVHSPPFLHVAHVEAAIAAGHAVLCDKPFGRDLADAQRLVDVAARSERPALVNFEFRYDPVRIALRDLVRSGRVGEIRHVAWTHLGAGGRHPPRRYGWLFDRARGGGWLGAWGSHAIDALRWVLDDEIVDARARLRTDVVTRTDTEGTVRVCTAEDGFAAWLTLARGTTAAIDTTFVAPAPLAPRLVLVGTDAVAEVVGSGVRLRTAAGEPELVPVAVDAGDPHLAPMRAWAGVVRDALRSGTVDAGAPTFANGLACAWVLDALRGADGRAEA
jgi:predicted dehydrogenase